MPATTRTSVLRGRLRRPLSLRRPSLPNPDDPLGLFGDGPPTWTINKDKVGERKSPSAGEATRQRTATLLPTHSLLRTISRSGCADCGRAEACALLIPTIRYSLRIHRYRSSIRYEYIEQYKE